MGQRSQIYIRYNVKDRYNEKDRKGLIANYYRWNFGERMISRARGAIEHIAKNLHYDGYYDQKENSVRLSRIADTNFDMRDVQISCDLVYEWYDEYGGVNFNDHVFYHQDNNDGRLLIDINNGVVKYAFLDDKINLENIMDAEGYMRWNNSPEWRESEYLDEEDVKVCEDNICYINDHSMLMTKEEIEEFLSYNYVVDLFG